MKRTTFLLLAIVLCCQYGAAQTGPAYPFVKPQFYTNAGTPCAACKLYTYAAGTTTPLATHSVSALNSANANPVVLDSAGRANIFLTAAAYKFVLKTSADVEIWTVDQIVDLGQLLKADLASTANGKGDALVGYKAAGGSAVDRTVHDRFTDWYSASDYTGADAGAKIAACIAALPSTGGTCDARSLSGAQTISTQITVGSLTKPVILLLGATTFTASVNNPILVAGDSSVIGAGRDVTVIQPTAAVTGDVIGFTAASQGPSPVIRGMTINMTSATTATGVSVNNAIKADVRDIQFTAGALGLEIDNTHTSFFRDLFFNGQTTSMIDWNGDTGMENHFDNIRGSVGAGVTMTTGFNFTRTSAGNIGGAYISNYILVLDGGNLTNNMKFRSTAGCPGACAATETDIRMYNVVSDSANLGDSTIFENINGVSIVNSHFGVADATANTYAALKIGNAAGQSISNYEIIGTNISGTGLGISVLGNNVTLIKMLGNRFFSTGAFHINLSTTTRSIWSLGGNFFNAPITTPVTNSPTTLLAALTDGGDGPYSVIESVVAAEPIAKILKLNSGTANQAGGTLFFDNLGPAATARNAAVSGGAIEWRFSQPTSGAVQSSAKIEALAGVLQNGTRVPTDLVFSTAADSDGAVATERARVRYTGALKFSTNGAHIEQNAANKDIAGFLTITSPATTASVTFTQAYTSDPVCIITPAVDPGAGIRWWGTVSTTAFTLNLSAAVSSTWAYHCIGNPN